MKNSFVLSLIAPILMLSATESTGLAQGQFLFNARDQLFGNDIRVVLGDGTPASGSGFFFQVFAGSDQGHLNPVFPVLSLNGTGPNAGYPNPSSQVYTTSVPSGSIWVGWAAFQGTGEYARATASTRAQLAGAPVPVTTPPSEVSLGSHTAVLVIPEPAAWLLVLIGTATVLLAERRPANILSHRVKYRMR
jgi:hypothetical protein